MGNATKIAMIVGIALALPFALIYYVTQVQMDTAERRGQAGQSERVKADGDYRIAAYDEFYSLCSTIQTKGDQIENLEAQQAATTDAEDKERLTAGITAQKNTRDALIREYNSKAAAEGTRGQFRDSELPYQIDPEQEDVECGS